MTVAVGSTSLVWPLYVVMGDYYAVCIGKFFKHCMLPEEAS